jgi:hypothetical protein
VAVYAAASRGRLQRMVGLRDKKNVGWVVPVDGSKIIDGIVYVCVLVNPPGEAPEYFILPPSVVREKRQIYAGTGQNPPRAILTVGLAREFKDRWDIIAEALAGWHPNLGPDSMRARALD